MQYAAIQCEIEHRVIWIIGVEIYTSSHDTTLDVSQEGYLKSQGGSRHDDGRKGRAHQRVTGRNIDLR